MKNKKTINVMVVDDHEMVRRGLISYLETESDIMIVGEACNGHEAISLCENIKPDVILMDLIMENMSGIEATIQIKKVYPDIKIIILTSFIEEDLTLPALEAGALSYLLKTSKAEEIIDAIRRAMREESVIEPKVATQMLSKMRNQEKSPHYTLTERELEVLKLIGNGLSNQEIAEKLYIGIKTVKTHVSNILSKLQLDDRTQVAIYAHRNKLV